MKISVRVFMALTLFMMGVVIWLSPVLVSATEAESEESERANPVISISNPPTQDINGIQTLCDEANGRIHDKGIWGSVEDKNYVFEKHHKSSKDYNLEVQTVKSFLTYSKKDNVVNIEVNMIDYRELDESEKQTVMQQTLDAVKDTDVVDISRTNRNKIYNNICSLDVSTSSLVRQLSEDVNADFHGAYEHLRPFSGPLGIFLGAVSLIMFALLAITIIIDLAYITLPVVQLGLSKTKAGDKPKFISIEAIDAVKEAESKSGVEYTNPVGKYFQSKSKQLIAIALCLTYLVSGEIYNLIGAIIDYFNMALNL